MQHLIKTQKGFSLVEVMVSMFILVLIAAVFINIFGSSISNIFVSGNKNEAMTVASKNMDLLYAKQPFDNNESIENILGSNGGNLVNDVGDVTEYKNNEINFYIDSVTDVYDNVNGYLVTIAVFYSNGERYVILSSFFRGETW